MDDKEIIALFLARDEGAIQAAQRQYGGYCAAIANGILDDRGAAEECVNDTWLKCWQSIPPQHPRSLKGFAGRIARNLALSVRRADMAQKRGGGQTALALDELSEVVSGGETPEGAMDRQGLRAAVDGFLAGLPGRGRGPVPRVRPGAVEGVLGFRLLRPLPGCGQLREDDAGGPLAAAKPHGDAPGGPGGLRHPGGDGAVRQAGGVLFAFACQARRL